MPRELSYIPKLFFLWIALSLLTQNAYNQQYHIHNYDENTGLLSSHVNDVLQDDDGRIWFATRGGVSVYDGHTWQDINVVNGLALNFVRKMFKDEKGKIWLLLEQNSEVLYYFENNKMDTFSLDHRESRTRYSEDIIVRYEGEKPKILLQSVTNELILVNPGKSTRKYDVKEFDAGKIKDIELYQGQFMIATDQGIRLFENGKPGLLNEWNKQLPSLNIYGLSAYGPRLYVSGANWVGYFEEGKFNLTLQRRFSFYRGEKKVKMIADNNDNLYFGDHFSFYQYQIKEDKLHNLSTKNGLIGQGVSALLIDREFNLWVTSTRGVSKIVSLRFANFNETHGLYEKEVSAITRRHDGSIVFGHNNGLSIKKGHSFIKIPFFSALDFINPGVDSRVLDMAADNQNNIWIASSLKGLCKLDAQNKLHWLNEKYKIEQEITSLAWADDQLWVLLSNNLMVLKDGTFKPYSKNDIFSKYRSYWRKLFVIDGEKYIATSRDGLLKVTKGKWQSYKISIHHRDSNNIYSVFKSSDGRLWVGSLNGLYILKNEKLVKYHKDFHIDRPVFLILEDANHNIWFGTDNGIIKYNGKEITNYSIDDGFVGKEINRSAGYAAPNGAVWIGTDLGAVKYQPDFDVSTNQIPAPLVYLNKLVQDTNVFDIQNERDIYFDFDENNLIFNFKAISFIDEDDISYLIRLEGFEKDWVPEHNITKRRYNNLQPGKYRFHVQAINKHGIKSEVISSDWIIIRKPIWKRVWFLLIVFGLTAGFLTLIFVLVVERRFTKALKKQVIQRTRELNEANKTKDKFLSILAHDLISPFNSLKGLLEIVYDDYDELPDQEKKSVLKTLKTTSNNTYNLLENLLNWSRTQNNRMEFNPEEIMLNQVVQENIELLNENAEKKRIQINNLLAENYKVLADKNMINTILRNLISNAIKFTRQEGEIKVHARRKAGMIEVSIEDNGVGIAPDKLKNIFSIGKNTISYGTSDERGTGLGLILCNEFVTKNNGEIWVESAEGSGSRFSFTLPEVKTDQ